MESKIKPVDTSFGDFHKTASHSFYIPALQRPYTWEAKKQVDRLWEDIVENDPPYYIGSIVAIMGEGTASKDQIIDGQQRLTTLNLILIAIRDVAKQMNKGDFDMLIEDIDDFLVKYKSDGKSLRLSFANPSSNEVYEAIVDSQKLDKYKSKVQERFVKNYQYILELVSEYVGKGKPAESRLKDIFFRVKNLQLIFIKCVDKSSAFKLFESINATGVDLSTNDLIKNSIFEQLFSNKEEYEYIEAEWKNMFEGFQEDSSALKTYIRHHWIATVDYTSHSKLFDDFIREYRSKSNVLAYAKSLCELSYVYRSLRSSSVESLLNLPKIRNELNEVRNSLIFLAFLRVDQVYPVLLNIYNTDSAKFKKDLVKLVAFQFIFKYVPGSPSAAEKIFANYCTSNSKKKISKEKMYVELLKLCKGKKDDFVQKLSEKMKYSGTSNPDIEFVLTKLMLYHGKPSGFSEPTIEHIIPQDTSDQIYSLLTKDFKENERYVNMIGNLTILERFENSSDKHFNQEFAKKYPLYKKHPFDVNKKIQKFKFDINPKIAIEKRTESIAGDIYDIFLSALESGKWPRIVK